jgi:penicillin-binding protein 1A
MPKLKPRRSCLSILFRLALIAAFLGAATAGVVVMIYGGVASRYDLSKLGEMKQRSIVLDCKGRELGRLHGENRVVVPYEKVSPFFIKALLAREDSRFYDHGGVDYYGVARAIVRDVKEKKATQGASTITMQLARNSFSDLNDKNAHRKLVEVMLAKRIEAENSKQRILELYVNRIFFGTGLYGIERAAKAYFNKSADRLSLGEAATLAGIIRSPNRFSPFRNWKGAMGERDVVLSRMVLHHYISQDEANAAKKEDMAVAAIPVSRTQENYTMEAVRRDLELILDEEDIEDGGLRVYTTVDKDLQLAADSALEMRLRAVEHTRGFPHKAKTDFDATWDGVTEPPNTPYLQGALISINNNTGGILAVVGGRSFAQSRYDRAMMGTRTIGSTIKPFVYAAAMTKGLLPGTTMLDEPIQPGELHENRGNWSPQNSDGKFLGPIPMALGLVKSRNAVTVRVGDYAGLDSVVGLMRDAGITEPTIRTPQIYIGNTGTSLKSLTAAMSIFPNQGVRRRPFIIDRIEDANGEVIYKTPVLETEVLPATVANVTGRLLERVVNEGTAAALRSEYGFKEKAGGKTGTTNDYKDAWFIGFTSEITTGVWVGFDAPKTIEEGGYGGKLALPIWADVMKTAVASGYKQTVQRAEMLYTKANLCRVSGKLATEGCRSRGAAYEDELPFEMVPVDFCTEHGRAEPMEERRSESSGGGFFSRLRSWFR